MAGVPAYCERCNTLFESSALSIGSGAVVTFANCGTSCPRCGGMARILDGTYSAVGAALQVLRGSSFTHEQVRRLQTLRSSLESEGRDPKETIPKEVIEAISAIQPELGAAVKLLQNGHAGWAVFMLFLFILIKQCSPDGGVHIDLSTHITTQIAPTRLEDTALYYPHNSKKQDGGDHANPTPGSAESEEK